jgi:thymidylate synthase
MESKFERAYLDLLKEVRDNGVTKSDRTGTGTRSLFGRVVRHDMRDGFPLLTTKKMHFKSIIHELLWFLRGDSNIKYLVDNGVSIWNEWPWQAYMKEHENRKLMLKIAMDRSDIYDDTPFAVKNMKERLEELPPLDVKEFAAKIKSDEAFASVWGELGPVYGKQWRNWRTMEFDQEFMQKDDSYHNKFDQISSLIDDLKNNPDSRRMLVNAWNVGEISKMLLPPCHYAFQCWTRELSTEERNAWFDKNWGYGGEKGGKNNWKDFELDQQNVPKRGLSLMYQIRSNDLLLGFPFDMASYGLLLAMLAQCVNMVPEELVTNIGDAHIYLNHLDAVNEQLTREPFALCQLKIKTNNTDISNFKIEDFEFEGYESHAAIKAPIAI